MTKQDLLNIVGTYIDCVMLLNVNEQTLTVYVRPDDIERANELLHSQLPITVKYEVRALTTTLHFVGGAALIEV